MAPITMDLFGQGRDGQLHLWDADARVQPLDRFPRLDVGRVLSGHYVLEMGGRAIVAHVSNSSRPGMVFVQVMCRGTVPVEIATRLIEPDVLGSVIPDPVLVEQARAGMRELRARLSASPLVAKPTRSGA